MENSKARLGRSIAVRRDIRAGEMINEEDLVMLSPGDGLPWVERARIVGKRAKLAVPVKSHILPDMVE